MRSRSACPSVYTYSSISTFLLALDTLLTIMTPKVAKVMKRVMAMMTSINVKLLAFSCELVEEEEGRGCMEGDVKLTLFSTFLLVSFLQHGSSEWRAWIQ